jgi:Carboxypeptidase regulatory-like domain
MRCSILIFLLPFCLQLGAQQASFTGVVVNATTKEPLAEVHVTVLLITKFPDPNQPYGATSGPDGRFSIPNLPPGTYQLLPRHNDFLYLEAENRDASTAVFTLKPGETVTNRVVKMTPQAIISGRVVDEYGDPVEHASVRASAVGVDSSTSAVLQGMTARTDERGLFRIAGAQGKFRIAATTLGRMGAHEVRTDGSELPVYAETWFPASESQDRAAAVETVAGRETAGIDIRLVRKRSLTISGMVTETPEGSARAEVFVHTKFFGLPLTTPDADGRFRLSGLPAGLYNVWAHYQSNGLELNSAPIDVPLETANETGLNLKLSPGEELSGTLEFEGQPVNQNAHVRLEALSAFNWVAKGGEVDREGKFNFASVFPAKYRVRVEPLPENAFIKSVSADGAAAAGGVVDLSSGVRGSKIKITVGLNGASVEGTVSSESAKPDCCSMVVLADSVANVNDHMKPVRGGAKFRFTGLHPGRYRLIVSGPERPYGTQTAEELFSEAPEIELHEGDRVTRDVTLKPRGARQ